MDNSNRQPSNESLESLAKFTSENPNPVLRLDRQGVITYANAASAALLRLWGSQVGGAAPQAWREWVEEMLAQQVGRVVEVVCGEQVYSLDARPVAEAGYVNIYASDATERKRAEEAVARSERRFRALVEKSTDIFLQLDSAGTVLYVSPAAATIVGGRPEEWLGGNFATRVHPDEAARVTGVLHDVLAMPGASLTTRFRYRRTDDTWRWLEATATNLLADPAVGAIVANVRDITGRELAQDQLRFQAGLLAAVGQAVIATDLDGNIVYWNSAAETLYGRRAEEAIGQSAVLILPSQANVAQGIEVLERLRAGESWAGEFVMQRRDGTPFPTLVTSTPFYDPQGAPAGFIGVATDISEAKRADARLVLQSAALEAAANGIVITDRDGNMVWVNQAFCRLTGYAADEVLGRNPRFLKSGQQDQAFYANLWRTILAGQVWHGELVNQRKDGSQYVEEQTITPVRDEQGAVQHFVAVKQDVTARKQTEAAEREQRVLAEALRDTATALNSALELDELLGRILEYVGRVVPHEGANIMLVEGGRLRVAGTGGYPTTAQAAVADIGAKVNDYHNIKFMAETGQPLIIPDTHAYPGWVVVPSLEWVRSYVGAPIQVKGQIVGFINLDSHVPGFFTAAHAEHLRVFADQAGSAMENARLLAEVRQRLADLEAVNQVSTALRTAQTLDEMLPILLNITLAVLRASMGSIWLYDPNTDEIRTAVTRGWGEATGEPPLPPEKPGAGISGYVFVTGQPYIASDLHQDARLPEAVRARIPPGAGGATVPIRAGDKVIGTFNVIVQLPRVVTPDEVRLLNTLSEIAGNAIQRSTLHTQTERRLEHLAALREIDQVIGSSFDLQMSLHALLSQVIRQLGVDAADVLIYNPGLLMLEYAAGQGFRSRFFGHARLRLGEGYAGRAALERRTVHVSDLTAQRDNPRLARALASENFVTYYGVPLMAKGQIKGALEIFHRAPLATDAEWLDFLEALSGQAAIAIDNAQLFVSLERSNTELTLAYDATIEGWSRALELRDKETEGHTQRAAEKTVRLALAFGLHAEALAQVRWGALLHDIGKMGIPDSVLLKPGPLTDEEWLLMKQHPRLAYEMLSPISYLRYALEIPYCHHEKWDGTGYPRGLQGDQIPLAARLFAVVDVWDALTSDRPYRAAWSPEKVRQHIQALSGTHFDPAVVATFLPLVESD